MNLTISIILMLSFSLEHFNIFCVLVKVIVCFSQFIFTNIVLLESSILICRAQVRYLGISCREWALACSPSLAAPVPQFMPQPGSPTTLPATPLWPVTPPYLLHHPSMVFLSWGPSGLTASTTKPTKGMFHTASLCSAHIIASS